MTSEMEIAGRFFGYRARVSVILLTALLLLSGPGSLLCPNAHAQSAAPSSPPSAPLKTNVTRTETGRPVLAVPEQYRRAGRLRVATEANYPPFEFVEDKKIQGFDIDLGNALGAELGLEIVWVDTDWDGIVSALVYEKVDLIMSGMTIDEERKKSRAFTRPYFLSGQVIARRRGNTAIAAIDDLRLSGRSVAVQGGTTGEAAAIKANLPTGQIKAYKNLPEALLDVNNKKADAAIGDLPALRTLIAKTYPDLELVPGLIGEPEKVGIAARKDDLRLVHALNEAQDRLLVDGTYARLYQKWIGDPPRAELIAGLETAKGAGTAIPAAILKAPDAAAESPESAAADAPNAASNAPSPLAIRPDVLIAAMPALLEGAKVTLELTGISLLLGIPIGLMIALIRLSGVALLRRAATVYVEIIRGTPLLMQIFVLYYVLGTPDVGLNLPAFWAGAAALSLNAAAYLSEIFRAGIQSIDTGQMEAARSLGMTHGLAMRSVILPQALRRVLPPMTNEAVALLKDSSLVSVIALAELMKKGNQLVTNVGAPATIYLGVALLYLGMTLPLTYLVRCLEERWKPVRREKRTRGRTTSSPAAP